MARYPVWEGILAASPLTGAGEEAEAEVFRKHVLLCLMQACKLINGDVGLLLKRCFGVESLVTAVSRLVQQDPAQAVACVEACVELTLEPNSTVLLPPLSSYCILVLSCC
jgi:hypothetical protein